MRIAKFISTKLAYFIWWGTGYDQFPGPPSVSQPRKTAPLPLPGFYLFLTLFIISCSTLREPDFRAVENIRVTRLGRGESTLAMDVRYYNPNNTRVKLKEAGGSVWLDGNFLGDFKVDSIVRIMANAEFTLPVTLDVDMKKLFLNSLTAFLNKEVTVKLDGKAKLGKGFVFINYPIRYEGKQDVEKLLR